MAQRFASYKDATIIPINVPPIRELGTASGFDFELEDRGGVGHARLLQARDQLLGLARADPNLALVRPNGLNDQPTFKVSIDREKAGALGVNPSDIDQSFSINWGSRYVNNFLDTDGRIKRVFVQADAPFRMNPEDLRCTTCATSRGPWCPSRRSPPAVDLRLAEARALQRRLLVRDPGPGCAGAEHRAGDGCDGATRPAAARGRRVRVDRSLLQERLSGSQAPLLFALSIVVVFLSLAALYESWSIPIAVIMVVPLGVLGALAAATALGMSNDVYFKVGLLTTIGLSAKNAILIVEFARELDAQGRTVIEAAVEAAHLRLRPIGMTSMAFVLGVLPLALASGAGSGSENGVGTGVIGGMLTATFLAPFLIPMFFVVISQKLAREKPAAEPASSATPPVPSAGAAGD